MKSMTKAIAALAATSMLVSLPACGNKPGQTGNTQATGANVTTWAMTDSPWDPIKNAFKEWNKANPDAQISEESFANDAYKEKIRTAVGSGNAPTFFPSWGGSPLTDYVSSKAVTDLTSDLKDTIDSKVFDSVSAEGYRDGKLYAVPTGQAQPVLFFYNKQVLKDAGVDEAPQTWDDLLDAVAKLKAAGKTPIALAGGSKWPYLMWAAYLVDRIGGPEVFQGVLDGNKDAWSDPAVTQAMSMIQDLIDAGAFGNNYQSLTADDRKDTAMIDGAGPMRQFFSITLPQIKYTFATDSTLMIVGSLTYFDLVYVMTQGGPGNATRILPLDMYLKGFKSYDMGGASVVGVIILAMGIIISLLLNKLSGSDKMESQMEGV